MVFTNNYKSSTLRVPIRQLFVNTTLYLHKLIFDSLMQNECRTIYPDKLPSVLYYYKNKIIKIISYVYHKYNNLKIYNQMNKKKNTNQRLFTKNNIFIQTLIFILHQLLITITFNSQDILVIFYIFINVIFLLKLYLTLLIPSFFCNFHFNKEKTINQHLSIHK